MKWVGRYSIPDPNIVPCQGCLFQSRSHAPWQPSNAKGLVTTPIHSVCFLLSKFEIGQGLFFTFTFIPLCSFVIILTTVRQGVAALTQHGCCGVMLSLQKCPLPLHMSQQPRKLISWCEIAAVKVTHKAQSKSLWHGPMLPHKC